MNHWTPLTTVAFWSVVGFLITAGILVWYSFRPHNPKGTKNTKRPPGGPPPTPAEPPFPYLTIVRYDTSGVPTHQIDSGVSLRPGRDYLFLGEVPDNPGLCVVADFRSGQIYTSNTTMFKKETS